MLKINEIFFSAQGEGKRVGIPSLFIRFAGCSAKCSYCDTKDSWNTGKEKKKNEIIKIVESHKKKYNEFQIVITGGEPFEQDIRSLISELKNRSYYIAIETNGRYYYDTDIDWYAVSPKDVYNYEINDSIKIKIDEVKLIVNKNLSMDIVKMIRKIRNDFPIYLQPDHYGKNKYKETFLFYSNCIKAGINNIRLGFQLHKFYGIE